MTKGEKLIKMLDKYDLDLNTFLDMRDLWNGLKTSEKTEIIEHDYFKKHPKHVSGNPSNISKPNYENAHFNGEVD